MLCPLIRNVCVCSSLLATLTVFLWMPTHAAAIAIGPGDLVAVDIVSGNVVHIDPDTGVQTLISSAGGGEDVVIDDTGRIFITRFNDVIEVDPDTGVERFVVENASATFDRLYGLDLTPSGDLVVSPYDASPLFVDVDAGTATPIAGILSGRHGPRIEPTTGDLFFVQESTDEVRRYTPTGSFIQAYPLLGIPPNPFGRPGSLAFAPNGDLVVSDGNEEIYVRVDIATGALDPLDVPDLTSMSQQFDVDANGDYITPAIQSPQPAGIYRVDSITGAVELITLGGFLSTGNGLTSVAVAPATLPEPPETDPAFPPCPADGSALIDPVIICQLATGLNGPSFDSETGFPAAAGLVTDSAADAGAQADGSTLVDTQLGYAELVVVAEKSGTSGAGDADVAAGVHWQDSVTIDALGFTGNNGRFRGVFLLSVSPETAASLASGNDVLAEIAYTVDIETDGNAGWRHDGTFGLAESASEGPIDLEGGQAPGVIVSGYHDFVFGAPFEMEVDAHVRLVASGDGADSTALADVEARVVWLAIVDIESVGPLITPVPDVWVSSSSAAGVDWRTPIGLPEPGLGTMLIVGTLGVSALARHRRMRCSEESGQTRPLVG